MKAFLTYHLEVTVCMSIFYVLYFLLLRKDTDHRYVRFYLLAALVISFLLPLAEFQFFASPIEDLNPVAILEEFLVADGATVPMTNAPSAFTWNWQLIYWLISGGLLLRLAWEFRKLFQLNNRHIKGSIDQYNGLKVVVHDGELPTFSFMKTIYLSKADLHPEAARKKILAHEESHISGIHSFDRLLIELVRITCWFNPMIYLYKHALTLSHEYIADRETVGQGEPQQYVNLLVDQTLTNLGLSLGSHFGRKSGILSEWPLSFNKSQTLKRIKMIKNKRKSSNLKYLIPVLAIIVSIIVVSCMEDEVLPADNEVEVALSVQPDVEVEVESLPLDEGPVFTIVEEAPEYPGGTEELYKYLGQNIKYPKSAQANGLEGRVFVQFILDKDGSITYPEVIKGVSPELDEEALRVVSELPAWTPGKQRGRLVRVKMVLPIAFKLNGGQSADSFEQSIEIDKHNADEVEVEIENL